MIQTYQLSSRPEAIAGPNQRAGFIAAPVSGPPMRMSAVIANPMARPPVLGPRGSTAVPNTANRTSAVRTASIAIQPPAPTPSPRAGVPMPDGPQTDSGKTARSARPATRAPTSCATTYVTAFADPMRPAIQTPNVTAGLKCAPDTTPRAETSTP